MCYNLIIVPRNDHGLHVTSHLYLVIVPVDHKVLNMISYPLRTVVLVDCEGILLCCLCPLTILGASGMLRLARWMLMRMSVCVSRGGRSGSSRMRLMLVMGLLLCALRHILKSRISLLLLLLDNCIDIRHHAIEAWNVWHSIHKEHIVLVA